MVSHLFGRRSSPPKSSAALNVMRLVRRFDLPPEGMTDWQRVSADPLFRSSLLLLCLESAAVKTTVESLRRSHLLGSEAVAK